MFAERKQQVLDKVAGLIVRARQVYGPNAVPAGLETRFDLRGRTAGQAAYDGRGRYWMRFNTDMMQNQSWGHIYDNTVPHELAHIICMHLGWDRGHGARWREVCENLGGNGERCHSEQVEYANGKTFYYTTSTGKVISLSQIRHRKIQKGTTYRFRDGSKIDRTCAYTTENPTVVRPAKTAKEPAVNPSGASKAEQIRNKLRELKAQVGSEARERCIAWAVHALGMSATLARTYVINNWSKV